MKVEDLQGEYRKQAEAQLANRTSVCGGKPKQDRQDSLVEAAEIPRLHSPVYIRVTCYKRGENWDAENIETKAIIDSLVKSGVLRDDRVKELPQILKKGIVVKTLEEERTEIEVIEL